MSQLFILKDSKSLAAALLLSLLPCFSAVAEDEPSESELEAIADEAYIYGYPLVIMDQTKRHLTNVDKPTDMAAPVNQFAHLSQLPDASFKAVVRPNVDTLYSSAFLDLKKEPIVLHVPDTKGRFYMMPILDAYTNVFSSPGKRTTGTKARNFAIVGPDWNGRLPSGMTKIQSPTNMAWIIGRTQINGAKELPQVLALNKQFTLRPLSQHGKPNYAAPAGVVDAAVPMSEKPPTVVAGMNSQAYFKRLATLMKENPGSMQDRAAMARFAKLGLTPGQFNPSEDAMEAIEKAPARAMKRIQSHMQVLGKKVNGWMIATNLGDYGVRYLDRATVAFGGLGANLPQDAIYPQAMVDASGKPLSGESNYVLHFEKGQLPPAKAFWSVTVYDQNGYLVDNSIQRFAIGDRDKTRHNADGSMDIYIQHTAPQSGSSNWLPAPAGPFNLTLRVYWPAESALTGAWTPAAVTPTRQQLGGASPESNPAAAED